MPVADDVCAFCGHDYDQHDQTNGDCDVRGCQCILFDADDRG